MPGLPILSGKTIIKMLSNVGYVVARRESSHIRLVCVGRKAITIPDYRIVSKGLLRKILRDANLTVEQFVSLDM